MEKQALAKNRAELLDDIRGFLIIIVVVYHALYNLIFIFGVDIYTPTLKTVMSIVQPLSSGAFVFISGLVCRYSRSNIKRGAITLALGTLITIITTILTPYATVNFGILSFLGSSMLIFGILEKLIPQIKTVQPDKRAALWAVAFFGAYLFVYTVPQGSVGLFGKTLVELPDFLYQSDYFYFLGFPSESFSSSDYFPLIPSFFLFMSGTFVGVFFKEQKMPQFFYKSYSKIFNWLGKKSIWIYLFHQPVLMLIFNVVF